MWVSFRVVGSGQYLCN
uniref:Uncharacterized protein n=1 Tax=Anguilla anguilla TaxID=7936 RepID=A0A0E9PAC2_ANGAN